MVGSIQDRIYYNRTLDNSSFCLTFLKISRPVNSSDLAKELSELWKIYDELKKGKVKDLDTDYNHSHHGNLQWCMRIMKYNISVDPLNFFGTIKTIILYVTGMATLTYYIILSSNLSVIVISPAVMRKR